MLDLPAVDVAVEPRTPEDPDDAAEDAGTPSSTGGGSRPAR
ncbi:hypothetical protein [Georgenia sp. SUBG003]